MDDKRFAQIREREQAATPGPWITTDKPVCCVAKVLDGLGIARADGGLIEMQGKAEADAEFIAAARQDIPYLLAEVERLRAERDAAIGAI